MRISEIPCRYSDRRNEQACSGCFREQLAIFFCFFIAHVLTRILIAITNRSMTGGMPELREELFCLIFRTAALEGKLYYCKHIESAKILSLAAGFGPGIKFLGR